MTNVLEYLEHSARVCPDKTALIDPNGTCTYAQLEEYSRAVGSALAGYTAPGAPVVIWMEKSIPAVSAFMGCVYGGCFYVYLSPDQPKNRGSASSPWLRPDWSSPRGRFCPNGRSLGLAETCCSMRIWPPSAQTTPGWPPSGPEAGMWIRSIAISPLALPARQRGSW